MRPDRDHRPRPDRGRGHAAELKASGRRASLEDVYLHYTGHAFDAADDALVLEQAA